MEEFEGKYIQCGQKKEIVELASKFKDLSNESTQLRLRMQRKKVIPEEIKLELRKIRKKVRLGIKTDRI